MYEPGRLVVLGLGGNLGGPAAVVRRFDEALAALGKGPLRDLRRAPLYRTSPVITAPVVTAPVVTAPSETEETPAPRQPDYVNPDYVNTMAVGTLAPRLDTEDPARAARIVLGWCKRLEVAAGRDLGAPRDSPRPLDLDLLLLGSAELDLPELSELPASEAAPGDIWPGRILVPHPRLRQRRFVLRPLCDLLPELRLPPDANAPATTVREALAALENGEAGAAGTADEQRVEPLPGL